ncbi:MAG: dynamin family protein, partial [Myxococcales bacterium]|nr:dynamin family protein [Myxococcales bacterium]
MPPLLESLSRLASRVEILAAGVENERRSAEQMLEKGRALDAREHARAIIQRIPGSPLGLALWADAAEAAWLDDEALEALSELSAIVPWRADVWLRLGRVALRLAPSEPERASSLVALARNAFERSAAAPDERASARLALLELCDLDLAGGDPTRALLWLERVPASLTGKDEATLVRRAECALALGRVAEAVELTQSIKDTVGEGGTSERDIERIPGRRSLLLARVAWLGKSGGSDAPLAQAEAVSHALRAYILEAPGSKELLAGIASHSRDVKVVSEIRAIVAGAGAFDDPTFMAAFALAEGRRDDARAALLKALDQSDVLAAQALLRLAVETRDDAVLAAIDTKLPAALSPSHRALVEALREQRAGDTSAALAAIGRVRDNPELEAWAEALSTSVFAELTAGARAVWPQVLGELSEAARELADTQTLIRIEGLGLELERPVVVAIVGEFNAGKSTFINAFLGVDAAPTGILPTTATLHRVAWAADSFARVILRGTQDRVVPHEKLKSTLSQLQTEGAEIDRVQIYAPIERLRWVEILDTPGFNAPDPTHAKAAMSAFDEAHAVVWLLDATGPLKATEAAILKEVQARGLPIVVLLNKLDRLGEADLVRVVDHTKEGLGELGLRVAAGPLAFSAKLALAGRLGDAAALERSRWFEVESVLSATLVDRADELREAALRRRARAMAAGLLARTEEREAEAKKREAERVDVLSKLRAAAASLPSRRVELAGILAGAVDPGLKALAADLKPLGTIGEAAAGDFAVPIYASSRVVER